MNLIKAEFRKSLIEAVSYYPDYIVGLITDFFILLIVINTEGNITEKVIVDACKRSYIGSIYVHIHRKTAWNFTKYYD